MTILIRRRIGQVSKMSQKIKLHFLIFVLELSENYVKLYVTKYAG